MSCLSNFFFFCLPRTLELYCFAFHIYIYKSTWDCFLCFVCSATIIMNTSVTLKMSMSLQITLHSSRIIYKCNYTVCVLVWLLSCAQHVNLEVHLWCFFKISTLLLFIANQQSIVWMNHFVYPFTFDGYWLVSTLRLKLL